MKALQQNVSLAPWTTFKVGGPARYFLDAASESDILDGLAFAGENKLPVFVLGGGSNLLIADTGFHGLVLRVGITGVEWNANGDCSYLTAGAGEDWDGVVASSVAKNLGGIECLSGIPGLAGGTPVQNVGAYGQETSQVLAGLRAFDRTKESFVELSSKDCRFGYRTSIFNTTHRDRYIVTGITYALRKDAPPTIHYPDLARRFENHDGAPTLGEVRDAVRKIRAGKGMLIVEGDPDCRSAGSFFKNPIISEADYIRLSHSREAPVPRYPAPPQDAGLVKTSAAWLIEHAGYRKGFSIGPAAISTKHTLALVNKGGATAADMIRLAREIRRGVEDHFGVKLIPEPVFVGFTEEF